MRISSGTGARRMRSSSIRAWAPRPRSWSAWRRTGCGSTSSPTRTATSITSSTTRAIVRASDAPLAIHPDDAYRLEGRNNYGFEIERSVATQDLREGEQLRIGDLVFDILHTPGHTEGSVCLYEERLGLMLSGDVLFAGSYGRTDLPGGDDEADGRVAHPAGSRRSRRPCACCPATAPETTIERELGWLRRVAESGRLVVPG